MSDMKDKNLQLDLTDDFKCGELLLEADEDREAFKLFLRVAVKEKRQDAIDKLLYIALKNNHKSDLLDDDTWKVIDDLPKSEKGYEFAYLLLYFKYYAKDRLEDNIKAKECLDNYYNSCTINGSETSPIANLQKGKCLDFGVGISAEKVDAVEAQEYYQKALDGGCIAAYRHIVCLLIFGADKLEEDQEAAKQILIEAIKYLKNQIKKNRNDIKLFFEDLVDCCFLFTKKNLRKRMIDKGKVLAQYMIDHNIKGGYRLMGDFFLYSNEDFNMTMAKNYYMEAIKNKESAAYGQLAMINSIEGNRIETFRLAHQGCSKNHSFSYSTLGKMYEEQGNEYKENDDRAKKCYYAAWNCYEKAYYRFGLSPENLGYLYLDKQILPEGFELKELERILEIGAKQLRTESIKCYLRLILKKNGKTVKDSEINCEMGNGLPEEDRKKYNYYLEKGACTGDVKFIEEYIKLNPNDQIAKVTFYEKMLKKQLYSYLSNEQIESVYRYADDTIKVEVTKCITEQPYINPDHIKLVYKYADDTSKANFTKCLLKQRFVYADQIKSIYNHADDETKLKLTRKLLKEPYLLDRGEMKIVYNNSDEKNQARLFEKIIKECSLRDDRIEFIYKYADEKMRARISQKIVMNSYTASSKKQFVNVVKNFKGRQDDSFILWEGKSLISLFWNENKKECVNLIHEIKNGIEKTKDEDLKKLWRSWRSNVDVAVWAVVKEIDDESIQELCRSCKRDDEYTDWEAIFQSLSNLEKSEGEGLKEKYRAARKAIEDAIMEIVFKNPMDELQTAINNSKDKRLKEIYETFIGKIGDFMGSFIDMDD